MNNIVNHMIPWCCRCVPGLLLGILLAGPGQLQAKAIPAGGGIDISLPGHREDLVVGEPLGLQIRVPEAHHAMVFVQEGDERLVQLIPNHQEADTRWPVEAARTVPNPRLPYRLSLDEPGQLHVYVVSTRRADPRLVPLDSANPFPEIPARSQAELERLLDKTWGSGQAEAVMRYTIPVRARRPEDDRRMLTFEKGELQTEDYPRFSTGSAELASRRDRDILRQWGEAMNAPAHAGECYLIEGHADTRGKDLANLELGQRRAEAVVAFLVEQCGVPACRLTAISKGAFEPRADNADQQGRAENRRVEIALDRIEGSREAARLFTD